MNYVQNSINNSTGNVKEQFETVNNKEMKNMTNHTLMKNEEMKNMTNPTLMNNQELAESVLLAVMNSPYVAAVYFVFLTSVVLLSLIVSIRRRRRLRGTERLSADVCSGPCRHTTTTSSTPPPDYVKVVFQDDPPTYLEACKMEQQTENMKKGNDQGNAPTSFLLTDAYK